MSNLNQFFPKISDSNTGIKIIQSGTNAFSSGSAISLSIAIPIALANTGKSFLFFSTDLPGTETWTNAGTHFIYGTISNTTHLLFGRGKSSTTAPKVSWQIIEYY